MISIIVRTKNEERWISQCLKRIKAQTIKDHEIILVDNNSEDKTVEKALHLCPDINLVKTDKYWPGLALNMGIRASKGDYIACLSAHCLPINDDWLARLQVNFSDSQVAGVYGRQIPMRFTSPVDKRDLLVTFGLDKRIHKRDSFFHNANSMIRRDIWEKYPFDEEVSNIEDRVWGKAVIDAGYTLVYEPEAPVYHHHGIHQSNNKERYEGVVRILDKLQLAQDDPSTDPMLPVNLEILAVIPLRYYSEGTSIDENDELILKTIEAARNAKHIKRIIISTDTKALINKAEQWGVDIPFLRPPELSKKGVRVDDVLQYSINQLESQNYFPDLIVPLEITYPFRPSGLLDNLIERLLEQGFDTVIAGLPEYRPCWVNQEQTLVRIDDYKHTRAERKPVLVGLPSLGCVTYPEFIRNATRLGNKVGIHEIEDPRAALEIRTNSDYQVLKEWL